MKLQFNKISKKRAINLIPLPPHSRTPALSFSSCPVVYHRGSYHIMTTYWECMYFHFRYYIRTQYRSLNNKLLFIFFDFLWFSLQPDNNYRSCKVYSLVRIILSPFFSWWSIVSFDLVVFRQHVRLQSCTVGVY